MWKGSATAFQGCGWAPLSKEKDRTTRLWLLYWSRWQNVAKISKIRKNLDLNSPKSPEITSKHVEKDTSASMTSFTPATISEIRKIIVQSASTSCSSTPVPTWLLKEHLDVLLSVITDIVNMSLESGVFPDEMKHAMVRPLLKKSGLDRNLLKNFRPISNLFYLSKIIERVVASRLSTHMNENNLAEPMQSVYRPGPIIVLRQHYCMCIITSWGLCMNRRP